MNEECINDLAVALRDQLILVDDLRDQLEEAKANHENAVAHMQSVCAERDQLKAENKELRRILLQAIQFDGEDSEGVPAVWLSDAQQSMKKEQP